MKHQFKYFFLLFFFFALNSCQNNSTQTGSSPSHSNSLHINFNEGDPVTLHPHFGNDMRSGCVERAIFEGLVRSGFNRKVELALAETIDISPCQSRFIFHLRKASWSNGAPVTAYQFENAWKQAISPSSKSEIAFLFYIIKKAQAAKKGLVPLEEVGVKALDDLTLLVELEYPAPYFLEMLSDPTFFPLYDNSEVPSVYNGPFVVSSWKKGDSLKLTKNPLYWDQESVALDQIIFLMIRDANTVFALFEKGKLDWIGEPHGDFPYEAYPRLMSQGVLRSRKINRIYWLFVNTSLPQFSSAKIRKALSYAINRKALTNYILLGQSPIISPLPLRLTLLAEENFSTEGDTSLAQSLFQEGLEELGLTKESFPPIELSFFNDSPSEKLMVEAIQQMWKETLGISIQLKGYDWNIFYDQMCVGDFHIGGYFRSALFQDPLFFLQSLKDPSSKSNPSRWESSLFRSLVEEATISSDFTARAILLKKAEKELLDQMPIIPIYNVHYIYALRKGLEGVVLSNTGEAEFKWIHWAH